MIFLNENELKVFFHFFQCKSKGGEIPGNIINHPMLRFQIEMCRIFLIKVQGGKFQIFFRSYFIWAMRRLHIFILKFPDI
jgi:hypothetical protein